jgi:hypothetical protein
MNPLRWLVQSAENAIFTALGASSHLFRLGAYQYPTKPALRVEHQIALERHPNELHVRLTGNPAYVLSLRPSLSSSRTIVMTRYPVL